MRIAIVILTLVSLFLWWSPADAQTIGLYSDESHTSPFIDDVGGFIQIYVVLFMYSLELTQIEFAVPPPECMAAATLVGETSPFLCLDSVNALSLPP